MDFSQIVNTEEINPKALQYAEAILAGLPPKQAKIQRLAVVKLCQLLFTEGKISGKLWQIQNFTAAIASPFSEVGVIAGLLDRFQENSCDMPPIYSLEIRPEIHALPFTQEGALLCELAFRYFEHATGNKGTTEPKQ